jgi:hypothetical protein
VLDEDEEDIQSSEEDKVIEGVTALKVDDHTSEHLSADEDGDVL